MKQAQTPVQAETETQTIGLPVLQPGAALPPPTGEVDAVARPAQWTQRDERYAKWVASLVDTRYVDYPRQVSFELLALCNASCAFCPYPTMERKGDRMPDEVVDKILRELAEIPDDLPVEVALSRVNEPFLDKRIWDVARRVNDELPSSSIVIFTNGSPLVPALADRLPTLGRVATFNVSFNDHREDAYERTMKIPYARTVANLDHIHDMVVAGEIQFGVSLSRVGDGSPDDGAFIDWCRQRWPEFRAISTPRETWMGEALGEGAFQTKFDTPPMGCSQWFKLGLLAGGQDIFCCIDSSGKYGEGMNIADTHLLDIYNTPARRERRERVVLRGEVPGCRGCQLRP